MKIEKSEVLDFSQITESLFVVRLVRCSILVVSVRANHHHSLHHTDRV